MNILKNPFQAIVNKKEKKMAEKLLILKQDRPYHDRVEFDDRLDQTLNYFQKAGNDRETNIDVAGQISNSADFELFIMRWQFFRKDFRPMDLNDLPFLGEAVLSGFMSVNINKIDEWTGNISGFVRPPLSQDIDTRKDDQESGKYTLNVSLTIKEGQPIKMPISYSFTASPEAYTSEVTFYGVLKTYQDATVVTRA